MILLDGKNIADKILANIKKEITKIKTKPSLAVILVGDDPASKLYIRIKEKTCFEVGIEFKKFEFPDEAEQKEIINLIKKLNDNKNISGIIVQLPLPQKLNTNEIINTINPSKDVDGLHPQNLGNLIIGNPTVLPPTPSAILDILNNYKIDLKGKHVVIVGYGRLVGKPLSAMLALAQKDTTLTICNKETKNLKYYTKQADILVSATGVANLIKTNMVKKGVVVIDAGTTIIKNLKLKNKNYGVVGDVDFEKVKKIAKAITPSKGGIGPLTVAKLLENTVKLTK